MVNTITEDDEADGFGTENSPTIRPKAIKFQDAKTQRKLVDTGNKMESLMGGTLSCGQTSFGGESQVSTAQKL